MSILSGLRRLFKGYKSYIYVRVIYDKDDAWRKAASEAYCWVNCTLYPTRQGWTGEIIHCSENRITIRYDNGKTQSYSLDCILDKDLCYIKREDGEPW